MKYLLPLSIVALLVAGCSGEDKSGQTATATTVTSDTAPKKTIIDDQLRAMDKARGVGDTLQQTVDKNLDAADRQLE